MHKLYRWLTLWTHIYVPLSALVVFGLCSIILNSLIQFFESEEEAIKQFLKYVKGGKSQIALFSKYRLLYHEMEYVDLFICQLIILELSKSDE